MGKISHSISYNYLLLNYFLRTHRADDGFPPGLEKSFLLFQEIALPLRWSIKTRHCGLISRLQKSSLRAWPTFWVKRFRA